MFPLAGKTYPTNGSELGASIRQGLEEFLTFPARSGGVKVADGNFPSIKSLKIDLSGAKVHISEPPDAPQPKGKRKPGITLAKLDVTGQPIFYDKGKADLQLDATGLSFDFAHDAKGRALLVLSDVNDGHVHIKIAKDDLQAMLLAAAATAAKSQGVTIQDLDLTIDAKGDRSVAVNARITAKKLMMRGVIQVRGKADVDDTLVATLSDLACTGEGVIGAMAAKFLEGKLKKYNGRRIPLMAFSLGDVTLRDLKIRAKTAVELSASFGHKS